MQTDIKKDLRWKYVGIYIEQYFGVQPEESFFDGKYQYIFKYRGNRISYRYKKKLWTVNVGSKKTPKKYVKADTFIILIHLVSVFDYGNRKINSLNFKDDFNKRACSEIIPLLKKLGYSYKKIYDNIMEINVLGHNIIIVPPYMLKGIWDFSDKNLYRRQLSHWNLSLDSLTDIIIWFIERIMDPYTE